jgi:tRNA(Glu) U13 pseudouridine synthase TruD
MPFDGLPEGVVSDLLKLRTALHGVENGWEQDRFGLRDDSNHCAIGWLLVAADWNWDEATRLALDYVYPALPVTAQKHERLRSIWEYNDNGGHERIVKLFNKAIRLAEKAGR